MAAIGPYYWVISDAQKAQNVAFSKNIDQLISISMADDEVISLEELASTIHPDDWNIYPTLAKKALEHVLAYNDFQCERFKSSMYIRQKSPQGIYHWMMVQYLDFQLNEEGSLVFVLCVVTDVSHIKSEGEATLTVYDRESNETHNYYVKSDEAEVKKSTVNTRAFTRQELKILRLIAKGMSSKEIAAEMFLSVRTIDNHRQNMLQKTSARSAAELVAYGLKAGIL